MFLTRTSDWVGVLEACYAPVADDASWAAGVLEALGRDRNPLTGMHVFSHAPDAASGEPLIITGGSEVEVIERAGFSALAARFGARGVRGLYYPARTVSTQLEVARDLPPEIIQWLAEYRGSYGVADAIGLAFHPLPGIAGVVYQGSTQRVVLSRHERTTLARVALHLEAGYRLRLRPAAVLAVIEPSSKVVHREDSVAGDAPQLAASVRELEHARSKSGSEPPDALEIWTALMGGRASLVERREGTRRQYHVVENPPATQPLRALTSGEIAVLGHAARGMSGKLIGYALGVSPGLVSARLRSAATKLGVAAPIELVRIAAILTRDPRAGFEHDALTTAEREVLELLRQGLGNEEIARMRNRSVRTIANQVAALLRKTHSAGRRELISRA